MSKFGSNVKRSKKVKRETKDKAPSFGPLESNIYPFKVEKAYIDKTESGAMMFKIQAKEKSSGKLVRMSECFQSGDAKGNKIYYTDADGVDHDLPGYALLNDLIVCGMGDDAFGQDDDPLDIFELYDEGEVEKKKVKLYNFKTKKEEPMEKLVILPLVGATLNLGVLKVVENKTATDSSGKFMYKNGKPVPSPETREVNHVNYIFDSDGFTANEIIAEEEEPVFQEQWLDSYQGRVIDRTVKVKGGSSGSKTKRKPMSNRDVFND